MEEERKGLNLDQVRSERTTVLQPASVDTSISEPKSTVARGVEAILLNNSMPHPHQKNFKANIADLVKRCEKLPLDESLPGASSFFLKTKYHFSSESELPVVVMKSAEELEIQKDRRKGLVPFRRDSELLQLVKDSVKRSKKSKSKNISESTKPRVEDEDLDMFGGFIAAQPTTTYSNELEKPIFESIDNNIAIDQHDIDIVREALRSRAKQPSKSTEGESEDSQLRFGEKLDMSKFRSADSDGEDERKAKKRKENEIFQKVMHKLDNK